MIAYKILIVPKGTPRWEWTSLPCPDMLRHLRPQLVYDTGAATAPPPAWRAAGFGIYAFRHRIAARGWYAARGGWLDAYASTVQCWRGEGEELDNACRYEGEDRYKASLCATPAQLRAYIEQRRQSPFSGIGEKAPEELVLASFTPRAIVPFEYGRSLADPAWERWSADEAAYAYDFETTSARKFVREGYYGHNGRLREIAKRWR